MAKQKPWDQRFKEAQSKIDDMAAKTEFTARQPSESKLVNAIAQAIPLASGVLRSINTSGSALSQLASVGGMAVNAAKTAGTVFQFSALGVAVLDFLRLPIVIFASLLLRQKPPIKLSELAKFLYASLSLALLITAVVIPAIAPLIAMGVATLTVGVAAVTFAKYFVDVIRTNLELRAIKKTLLRRDLQLASLKEELSQLQTEKESLADRVAEEGKDIYDEWFTKVNRLHANYNKVQELLDRQALLEKKQARLTWATGVDKMVGLAIAAGVITGLILSAFFPPVGLGIAAGTAAFGGAYIVARVGGMILKGIYNRLMGKGAESNNQPNDVHENLIQAPVSNKDFSSIASIMKGLAKGSKKNGELSSQINRIDASLVRATSQDYVEFFKAVAKQAEKKKYTKEQIKEYLEEFVTLTDALTGLKFATISSEDAVKLKKYQPFADALDQLAPPPQPGSEHIEIYDENSVNNLSQ